MDDDGESGPGLPSVSLVLSLSANCLRVSLLSLTNITTSTSHFPSAMSDDDLSEELLALVDDGPSKKRSSKSSSKPSKRRKQCALALARWPSVLSVVVLTNAFTFTC